MKLGSIEKGALAWIAAVGFIVLAWLGMLMWLVAVVIQWIQRH